MSTHKNTQIKWVVYIFVACLLLSCAAVSAQDRPPKPQGQPDLAVTGMNVSNWDNCHTEITIANTGDADSVPSNIKIEAFKNNQWQVLGGLWPVPAVAAGQTAAVIAGFSEPQIQIILSSTKLRATLDPENKINEKNKANNTFEISISPPKADLTVTNIQVTDFAAGKVTVGISNTGDAASVATAFKLEAFSNNQWSHLVYYNFPAVAPGQNKNFVITLDDAAKQKLLAATKLKGTIDFYTNVDEKNENNNTFETAFSPPKQDLIITGMKVLNWENWQTEIIIANIGELSWGTFNVKLEAFCNNQWQVLGVWPSDAVAPGQTTVLTAGFNQPHFQILSKSTKLRAVVDPENKIDEKNEGNNTFEIPLNPPKADLIITNMKVFSWKEWATEVTITNTGEAESGACNFKIEAFCNNQWQTVGTWPCGPIKPGQTAEKNVMFPQDTILQVLLKSTKLKATIDFNNEVYEKNEANNSFEIPVSPPNPDLTVNTLDVLDWSKGHIKVVVANTGDFAAINAKLRVISFSQGQWLVIGNWDFANIPAGQMESKVLGLTPEEKNMVTASSKIKAIIDCENKITEKNENNNALEKNVIINVNFQ